MRAVEERRVESAIVFSAAHAFADYRWRGGGPPADLTSTPLVPPSDIPDVVMAGLAALPPELKEARHIALVSHVREAPVDDLRATVSLASLDLHGDLFGSREMSRPDRLPRSKMQGPHWMSLHFGEPWERAPKRDAGKAEPEAEASGPEFIMPFERGRVTSLFHQGRYHPAIDLAGALGSRVHSTTRRQRVTFTGWRNGYGNTVVTRDEAGRQHLYAHLQRIFTKVGTVLDQGQQLGALGSTGHSTGPHVHYEVKGRNGAHINPVTLLFGRRVGRGFAWNGSRSMTRVAARTDAQPRPR